MILGKGMMTWKLKDCAKGNPQAFVAKMVEMGVSWVGIKMADDAYKYNLRNVAGIWLDNLVEPFVTGLRDAGIKVVGWQWVNGDNPQAEAERALERINKFKPDAWAVNAEARFKEPLKENAARTYMNAVKNNTDVPVGLTSYRYPSLHPEFPWSAFMERIDFHMPQVYWVGANNPGYQLKRSIQELTAKKNIPVIPLGIAANERGWVPTVSQLNEFDKTARDIGLQALGWWVWDNGGVQEYPAFYEAIRAHQWGQVKEPSDSEKLHILWLAHLSNQK